MGRWKYDTYIQEIILGNLIKCKANNTMLRKIKLGDYAYQYMMEQLSLGDSLAHYIQNLNLLSGTLVTYLPEDIDESRILSLSDLAESLDWLFGKEPSQKNQDFLNSVIFGYLKAEVKNCFLYETGWLTRDPIVSKREIPYLSYNEEVIGILENRISRQLVESSLLCIRRYPFIGILSNYSSLQEHNSSSRKVDKIGLDSLVKQTKYVIIGAFDDEGYVIWCREGDPDLQLSPAGDV